MSSLDSIMHTGSVRELAARENDGIHVQLLWESGTDELLLVLNDTRTEEIFELPVPRDRALDAFHHPFTYIEAALPWRAEQVAA
jgi:hypothetical protein